MAPDRAKRAPLQALDQGVQKPARSEEGIRWRIELITLRRRLLDAHDAVAYACKPLTDAIADRLGVSDNHPAIEWSYTQLATKGTEGVIVRIETISPAVARNHRPYIRKTDSALATEGQAAGENNNP